MAPSLRTLFLGPSERRFQRRLDLLFVGALFLATVLAYAVGLLEVTGGVVFLPMDAALVGTIGAVLIGYRQSGLGFGWLAAYAPLLGFSADHYLLGLSSQPIPDRVMAFFEPDSLAFLAVEAVVLGTLAWVVGIAVSYALDAVRERA